MLQFEFLDYAYKNWSKMWDNSVWFTSSADESLECFNKAISIHPLDIF